MTLKTGGTPLRKSLEMCGRCNDSLVYHKNEGKNPFDTFKDRRCAAILDQRIAGLIARRAASKHTPNELMFVHITSGNSGFSLGMLAKQKAKETSVKIHVVNIVDKGVALSIKEELGKCSHVIELDLGNDIISDDKMVELAKEAVGFEGPDENIIGVEDYRLSNGYRKIVEEIKAGGVKPDYIFCPIGGGELAVELAEGAGECWGLLEGPASVEEDIWDEDKLCPGPRKGDEEMVWWVPKIIGVTIPQNAILKKDDFLKNPGKNIADKLVNGYSKFKDLVRNLVKAERLEIKVVGERAIAKAYKRLNRIGIPVEPSAAVAFVGAEQYELKPSDTVVIVNTGKGNYDQKAVDKLWKRRLWRIAKYAAIVALSVAATFGVFQYKEYLRRENRFLELQQRELIQQVEYETVRRVLSEATHLSDTDGNGHLDHEEFKRAVTLIPGRENTKVATGGGFYESLLHDYTEEELRFLIRFKQLAPYGTFERRMIYSMEEAFRERMESGEADTTPVGDRFSRIFNHRQVKAYHVDIYGEKLPNSGHYCTFRNFDVNNPFDPSKEEVCDD